jgi:mono/diheme cytochrome c family protein
LTGIMLAAAPFNWQLTDSYFVVAHFHYTLIGGMLFALFGGVYYWFPKATGKMLSETLGKWSFWLLVIGFHMTFDPLHFAGLLGMPRRIYTYPAGRGWEGLNLLASIGVIFQGAAVALMAWNIVRSLRSGKDAGKDPWDAWTLEWATSSPPPEYNFAVLPEVRSSRAYEGPLGNAAAGAVTFRQYCAGCHGPDGTGVSGRGGGSAVDPAYLALVSDQYLRTTVIAGRSDEAIPNWRTYIPGNEMNPQEVSDIVAWLAAQRTSPDNRKTGGSNLP